LCFFCVPNAARLETLRRYRFRRLSPRMSGESLVSVHHHLLPRVDMVSRRLALVLCAFGYIQQCSSSAEQCGDQTERNKGLPRNRHTDDKQNTLAVVVKLAHTVFGAVWVYMSMSTSTPRRKTTRREMRLQIHLFLTQAILFYQYSCSYFEDNTQMLPS